MAVNAGPKPAGGSDRYELIGTWTMVYNSNGFEFNPSMGTSLYQLLVESSYLTIYVELFYANGRLWTGTVFPKRLLLNGYNSILTETSGTFDFANLPSTNRSALHLQVRNYTPGNIYMMQSGVTNMDVSSTWYGIK